MDTTVDLVFACSTTMRDVYVYTVKANKNRHFYLTPGNM